MARFRNLRTARKYRNARAQYLQENPWCALCTKEGRHAFSCELDHIIPLFKGGSLWDKANWQALCKPCHDKKSQEEKRQIIGTDAKGNLLGTGFVKL